MTFASLRAQILHLDVKSSNVLLTRMLTAKISDVGVAKVMSSDEGVVLTQVLLTCLGSLPEGLTQVTRCYARMLSSSDRHSAACAQQLGACSEWLSRCGLHAQGSGAGQMAATCVYTVRLSSHCILQEKRCGIKCGRFRLAHPCTTSLQDHEVMCGVPLSGCHGGLC